MGETQVSKKEAKEGLVLSEEEAGDIVDRKKGEEVDPMHLASSLFDGNEKALARALKEADELKEAELAEVEQYFWRPAKLWDPKNPKAGGELGFTLRGLYMGFHRGTNKHGELKSLYQHSVIITSPKTGKPVACRFNGTTILNKQLAKVPTGCPIEISYLGRSKTQDGENLDEWNTRIPKSVLMGETDMKS